MDNLSIDPTGYLSNDEVQALLEEAVDVAENIELSLGQPPDQSRSSRATSAILRKMQEEVALLPPVLSQVVRLDELAMNSFPASLNTKFDYYYLPIPLSLYPRAGWEFWRLEFQIEFLTANEDGNLVSTIYDMFPRKKWQDVISLGQSLEVGVDINGAFNVLGSNVASTEGALSAEAKTQYQFLVGPFRYLIKRAEIVTAGKGSTSGFWRLDGVHNIEQEDLEILIVLQVPKWQRVIPANGYLKVSRRFSMLAANLVDIWVYLSEKTRNYFKADAPLYHMVTWNNVLEYCW